MNPALNRLPTGTQVTALHDRLLAHPGWPRKEPPHTLLEDYAARLRSTLSCA